MVVSNQSAEIVEAHSPPQAPLIADVKQGLSPIERIVWRLVAVLAALTMWWFASRYIVDPIFLPGPQRVWDSLVGLISDGGLGVHVWSTLRTALIGFALGTSAGVLCGFIVGLLPRVEDVVAPFVSMANSAPRIALAPLFVLWFGIGLASHVALVITVTFFIMLNNTISGTQAVDRDHLLIARLLGASRPEVIRKVIIPSTVPWVIAATRLAWAWSVGGAVVAEMFLGQRGLGYLISSGQGFFNIALIFAAMTLSVALAFLGDNLISRAEERILRWRPPSMSGGA